NAGDYAAAFEPLAAALEQEPDNPLPSAYLAFVAAHQGLIQEARDFIAECERIAPHRADLIAAFGETLLKTKHPNIAAEYLEKAIGKQPDLYAAYPALGQSLDLCGRHEEAVAILQSVAQIPSAAQTNIRETLRQIQPMKFCSYLFACINFEPNAIQPCCDTLKVGVPSFPFTGGEVDMQAYNQHIQDTIRTLQKSNKICEGCQYLKEIPYQNFDAEVPHFYSVSINKHRHYCNLRCEYCDLWENRSDSYEILPPLKSLHQQGAFAEGCSFHWGGGEPSILKEFEATSVWISEQGFQQYIHTNALRFSPEISRLLQKKQGIINVSLDASCAETYKSIKGIDSFNRVIKNLRRYIEAAQDKKAVVIKYIVYSKNNSQEEIINFCKLCHLLGIKEIQFSFDFREVRANTVSDDSIRAANLLYRSAKEMGMNCVPFYPDPKLIQRMAALSNEKTHQTGINLQSLNDGIRAFKADDYVTALECLTHAMSLAPDNPLPPAYLAFIAVHQGLIQEARDFIAECERIAPHRTDLIAAFGETLLKASQAHIAAEYLEKAIGKQPDLYAAYPALAKSLHLTGRSAQAVSLLTTAAGLPSDSQQGIQSCLLQILAECGDVFEFSKYTLRFSHGLSDDLLAARCFARFDENGEALIESLSRAQEKLRPLPGPCPAAPILPNEEPRPLRIAFMVGEFTSSCQLEQIYALFLHLPPERFFNLLISSHGDPRSNEPLQMCGLLADSIVQIPRLSHDDAVKEIREAKPDVLIDTDAYAPSERLEAFLAAPVPHKFLWGEAPMPPIAPGVRTLAGALLALPEASFPTLALPGMGEVFNLPELPFTDDAAQKWDAPLVLGCLVCASNIARNSWQLMARVLAACPGSALVINLEALGPPAREFIRSQFELAGIDTGRLIFISARTAEELCLAWQSIDLGLLPPVHPGGLALPTALWMGRPCVALASLLPWSQRPSALLKALGKEAWVALAEPQYLDIVQQLAPQGQRVTLHPDLRERMKALGLTRPEAFAQGFAEVMDGLLNEA
ncbi:MAG: radical SAM protein, partial [Azoarcus sp.]|nr:radical SAM protein [Azoarcus sp.]